MEYPINPVLNSQNLHMPFGDIMNFACFMSGLIIYDYLENSCGIKLHLPSIR